jgi:hypothetical protein
MSIDTEVVASCTIFRGESSDPMFEQTVLLETYTRYKDGTVELAFNADGKRRIYLRFPLAEVSAIAGKIKAEATP